MKLYSVLASLLIVSLTSPAFANPQASAGNPGSTGRKSMQTANLTRSNALKTASQRIRLRQAGFGNVAPQIPGGGGRNGLPNTRLDSFVLNSGGLSEAIYGDEGSSGPPPYFGMSFQHTIGAGIYQRGLSTGHSRTGASSWLGDNDVVPGRGFNGGQGANFAPNLYLDGTMRGDMEGEAGKLGGEEKAHEGFQNNTQENGDYDSERGEIDNAPGSGGYQGL
jgi:hypothetical protein